MDWALKRKVETEHARTELCKYLPRGGPSPPFIVLVSFPETALSGHEMWSGNDALAAGKETRLATIVEPGRPDAGTFSQHDPF